MQHPLETAIVLADLQMDRATVVAGLLHDVPEDTDVHPGGRRGRLRAARWPAWWTG